MNLGENIMEQPLTNEMKAHVLTAALPYIQKYAGKVVVIKYGGNAMINPELKAAVMSDIILLSLVGIRAILVHGGGPEITGMLNRLNIPSKFINGLRYTDAATAEVVQMVLAGKTNKDLVALIGANGGKALGFCGIDDQMIQAKKMAGDTDYGYVGEITGINAAPILNTLAAGYIPVIATVGVDHEGNVYNINADTAAAAIASALGAANIILMTDTRGLLRDLNDPSTLISEVYLDEIPGLIEQKIITGGMLPKTQCCIDAINNGVNKAVMIDGRIPHSILIEMFSTEGIGTMFKTRIKGEKK